MVVVAVVVVVVVTTSIGTTIGDEVLLNMFDIPLDMDLHTSLNKLDSSESVISGTFTGKSQRLHYHIDPLWIIKKIEILNVRKVHYI